MKCAELKSQFSTVHFVSVYFTFVRIKHEMN